MSVPYSIEGTEISVVGLTIAWDVNGLLLDIAGADDEQEVFATAANENGKEILTVDMSSVELGSADDDASVRIYLCEVKYR